MGFWLPERGEEGEEDAKRMAEWCKRQRWLGEDGGGLSCRLGNEEKVESRESQGRCATEPQHKSANLEISVS